MNGRQMVFRTRLTLVAALALLASLAAIAVAPRPASAASYPDAVLLVSGFQTETPFTSASSTCAGKEGDTWGLTNGIGAALRAAGKMVFTAPETKTGDPVPASCVGPGEPVPPSGDVIATNGDTDANGAALANLIAFLRDQYGVTNLHIVGHSDGGLWSRAAITQDSAYAGVTIQSLTTLGTPHTGSYLADLAMEMKGGKCDFSNSIEQDICDAVVPLTQLIVKELGPKATAELSNDYLTTWNAQQQIGNCPVSTIAGDHVSFGLPFLGYYTPSDGLVGEDSAEAQQALDINGSIIPAPDLPGLRQAGVYDVVHGASLSFLYGKTLLNQGEISQQVTDNTLLAGPEPCNVTGLGSPPSATAHSLRAPLYRMVAASKTGKLPKFGKGDFVVSLKGVKVRCGRKVLSGVPLLGDKRALISSPGNCSGKVTARKGKGKARAKALMLDSNAKRDVSVKVKGRKATFKVLGKKSKVAGVQVLKGRRWHNLKLDRHGSVNLPGNAGSLTLRVRVPGDGPGATPDTANLTLKL